MENRTYDQVFGWLGKGNGDPSLNLFGEESAPNQRELARRSVTLDNVYVDGGVLRRLGMVHRFVVQRVQRARMDDRVRRTGARRRRVQQPSNDPGRVTGDSRIWDRLDDAGKTFRNYGMWAGGPLPARAYPTEPRLGSHA